MMPNCYESSKVRGGLFTVQRYSIMKEYGLLTYFEVHKSTAICSISMHCSVPNCSGTGGFSSENQSGGITALNVNTPNLPNNRSNKRSKIVKIISIIAAICTILGFIYVLVKDNFTGGDVMGDTYVSSKNQKGGITAHTVNINTDKARHLTDSNKKIIDDLVKQYSGKTFRIFSVLGDQESFAFAEELKTHLLEKGWPVEGVSQAAYNKPVKGLILTPDGDKVKIIVGSK